MNHQHKDLVCIQDQRQTVYIKTSYFEPTVNIVLISPPPLPRKKTFFRIRLFCKHCLKEKKSKFTLAPLDLSLIEIS